MKTSDADHIVADVRSRTAKTDAEIRQAVIDACSNLLKNPRLPGQWWAEQIVLEAVRILESQ